MLVGSLQGMKHDLLHITFHRVLGPFYRKQDLQASVLLLPVRSVLLGSLDVFGGSGQELKHVRLFFGVGRVCRFRESLDDFDGEEYDGGEKGA